MFEIFQRLWNHLCPRLQGVITLLMGTEMVSETLQNFNRLTWLIAREDLINL
jgi:hypothetical protein